MRLIVSNSSRKWKTNKKKKMMMRTVIIKISVIWSKSLKIKPVNSKQYISYIRIFNKNFISRRLHRRKFTSKSRS
jgi:hypothetical protein